MTHLILHKVRGEPAFDVAEKIQIGEEEGWIIPTSGHRAYPYATFALNTLTVMGWMSQTPITEGLSIQPPDNDWPDHYATNDDTGTITSGVNVMAIISKLLPKIKRRL